LQVPDGAWGMFYDPYNNVLCISNSKSDNLTYVEDFLSTNSSNKFPQVPDKYSIVFEETGLLSGTLWSVELGGNTESTYSGQITFLEANGSYIFQVQSIPGYSSSIKSGTLYINGSNQEILYLSRKSLETMVKPMERFLHNLILNFIQF